MIPTGVTSCPERDDHRRANCKPVLYLIGGTSISEGQRQLHVCSVYHLRMSMLGTVALQLQQVVFDTDLSIYIVVNPKQRKSTRVSHFCFPNKTCKSCGYMDN